MKPILTAILLYIGYKLIFGFILPLSKAARNMKQAIKNAQDKNTFNAEENTQNQPQKFKPAKEDYIEFEELKKE